MTTLQDLHRALSEAESGSRELDAMIAVATETGTSVVRDEFGRMKVRTIVNGMEVDQMPPHLSTSLDAITSLIERKLPGWSWAISSDYHPEELGAPPETIRRATLTAPLNGGEWDAEYVNGSPALALAASLVSALIAQEGEK